MQKKTMARKIISAVLCFVLIAAAALFMTACSNNTTAESPKLTPDSVLTEGNVGQGETSFTFTVVHADGSEVCYTVNTDKKTVGEALGENGLISGDEGAYGLYVKTVDGETLDYETDGMYWAFYQGDDMSPVGVDMAEITPNTAYSFKAEK